MRASTSIPGHPVAEEPHNLITVRHWGRLLDGALLATSSRVPWADLHESIRNGPVDRQTLEDRSMDPMSTDAASNVNGFGPPIPKPVVTPEDDVHM